jgi:3-hydroxybutyryl-CoA dehydrogenase
MKIAAVGNEWSAKVLASRTFNPGVEWIWVDEVDALGQHRDAVLYADLDFKPDEGRIRKLNKLYPIPVLINSVVEPLTDIAARWEMAGFFIRINGWPGVLERTPCELAVRHYCLVPDIPGLISGRILAAIINEAWFTLQDGVSTKEEIDLAMRLGTNYPVGPFEWGERIGLEAVHALLAKMSDTERQYCPAGALTNELQKVKI